MSIAGTARLRSCPIYFNYADCPISDRVVSRVRAAARTEVRGSLIGTVMLELVSVVAEPTTNAIRPGRTALFAVEPCAVCLLKVGRLCEQEELIDGPHVDLFDPSEVDAHAEMRQVQHRLFAADGAGVQQHAV